MALTQLAKLAESSLLSLQRQPLLVLTSLCGLYVLHTVSSRSSNPCVPFESRTEDPIVSICLLAVSRETCAWSLVG